MAKLVEELRNARIMGVEEMCWQAADEIERLRAENVDLRKQVAHETDMAAQASASCVSLRARVKELEAKLSYMTQWIEVNHPDAFKRGLWDAIADGDSARADSASGSAKP